MQTRSSSPASADQLQIVDPNSLRRKDLPGWRVVNQWRSSGSVDTYFVEPGTGKKFPSIEAAHRNFSEEVNERRLTRARVFFEENVRAYEGSSKTKQNAVSSLEYASKGFRLPKGWSVEEFPRSNSTQIDKYYVERRTGKRFRSLVSIERYLKDSNKRSDDGQQRMLLEHHHRNDSNDFKLPDGWIVEERPRRNSSHVDGVYIEPGTGNKFRSLASVERYLQGVENNTLFMNESGTGFKTEAIDPTPPKKVKWVLTGPGGNMFTPHVSGSGISSMDKLQWSETFVSLIQDRS